MRAALLAWLLATLLSVPAWATRHALLVGVSSYPALPERRLHGSGLGTTILKALLAEADATGLPVRLEVLTGSKADRLYLRHGFVATGDGEWDIDYVRLPQWPSVRAVRGSSHAA